MKCKVLEYKVPIVTLHDVCIGRIYMKERNLFFGNIAIDFFDQRRIDEHDLIKKLKEKYSQGKENERNLIMMLEKHYWMDSYFKYKDFFKDKIKNYERKIEMLRTRIRYPEELEEVQKDADENIKMITKVLKIYLKFIEELRLGMQTRMVIKKIEETNTFKI